MSDSFQPREQSARFGVALVERYAMSKETPSDDPRQKTESKTTKQTDKPWKGATEKEQLDPDRPKPDLEKWHDTNTH
jgi:hypothetical protein